jgi:hypothetical protein
MRFSKSKWFAYTLLVGLIPALIRLLVWFVSATDAVEPITAIDLVTFGLVLNASVISEVEHLPAKEQEWKNIQVGLAITSVTIYGALYALAVFGDKVDGVVDGDAMLSAAISVASMSASVAFVNLHHLVKRSSK